MSLPIFVTSRAEEGLKDIARYTFRVWDKEQTARYQRKLNRAFIRISKDPYLGKNRSEFGDCLRSYKEKEHFTAIP